MKQRLGRAAQVAAWAGDERRVVVVVPELDDYLRPPEARERFAAIPHATLIAVEGGKHLWVGENQTRRVLTEIVAISRSAMPGADAASITLIRHDRAYTAAYDGQIARDADELQYQRGQRVRVHYDPADPQRFSVGSFDGPNYTLLIIVFGVIAAGFLALGAVWWLLGRA